MIRVAFLADVLAFWVDEVGLAVEIIIAKVLDAHSIYRTYVVLVRHRSPRLLNTPQVLRKTARSCRGIKDDLSTIEAECTPAFGKMSVVADVNADLANRRVENRIATITWAEVELLPKATDMRDVMLAVLTKISAICINNSRGIVENTWLLFFIHWQHHDHVQFFGQFLKSLGGRAGDGLGVFVELGILDLAKIRAVEQLLEANHLGPLSRGLSGVILMCCDHGFFVAGPIGLDEGGTYNAHAVPP